MTIHGIDASTNVAKPIKMTDQKLHIKGSEIETKLDTINTSLGSLSVSVGDVNVNTDGLEGLVGTSNTSLSAIEGSVDGIEGLIGTTNTTLTAISDSVDGLESLIGDLDTAQDLTNTKLTALVSASGINRTSSTFMSSVALAANSQHSSSFDASSYKSVRILGSSLNGGSLNIMGSVDNSTWYVLKGMYAQMDDSYYNYSEIINNAPKYITIKNQGSSDTVTIVAEGQSF